ncbi:MAG: VCBS repeat-containing protein [Acidobacteria bacterium]|nr:VCBS repeat-containing protein [Acidobacteriota bacterium]
MKKCIFLFAFILVAVGSLLAVIPTAERDALIALYHSTNGPNWYDNTGWLGPAGTECDWFGIECDAGGNHVTQINLGWTETSGNNLIGTLPPELGNLTMLQRLDLEFNYLSGQIPPEYANLQNLIVLHLGFNLLNLDSIPAWLYNLPELAVLDLAECGIGGTIPSQLAGLTGLWQINLGGNQLSGTIPAWLAQLSSLESLFLWGNQLHGAIPSELGNLYGLELLSLFDNQLSGSIPSQIGNLEILWGLWLFDNLLTGPIPPQIGQLGDLNYFFLDSNQLTGEVPSSILNLNYLMSANPGTGASGLGLWYNGLYSTQPTVVNFINAHQLGEFGLTQTSPPAQANYGGCYPFFLNVVNWTPISYQEDPGYYEIHHYNWSSGGYDLLATTRSKQSSSHLVPMVILKDSAQYKVRAVTEPHSLNKGAVTGDFVDAQAVEPNRYIAIEYNPEMMGSLYPDSASQIVPATYLTFRIDPILFPDASPENPAIIQLTLPEGAYLSQTLATGVADTAAPYPENGEIVRNLAVVEYEGEPQKGAAPRPVKGAKDLSFIEPWAVQLFRYVAGENVIQIRINRYTEDWFPEDPYNYLGFTIGLGAGVWPNTETSNFGEGGMFTQEGTLFYMDLREFPFDWYDNNLPVCFSSFWQYDGMPTNAGFEPEALSLFMLESFYEDPAPVVSQIGDTLDDYVVLDWNRDGFDDVVSISRRTRRLYFSYGNSDGTFQGPEWMALAPEIDRPRTLAAGDVNGDSYPDLLIGDELGNHWIITYENTMKDGGVPWRIPWRADSLKSPGVPYDSTLQDVNADGRMDYIFTDITDNRLNVVFGDSFSAGQAYATGNFPVALTSGDFNGDTAPDLAVANQDSDSVTVFWNNGTGSFSSTVLTGLGDNPVDVDAADFDRNGKSDLAVGLAGSKSLAVLLVQSNNQFNPATAQKVFFTKTPSALQADNFDALNGPDVLVGFNDDSKLALVTTNEQGILVVPYLTINSLGDVVVDPFGGVTLTEDNILSVGGGTGFGGVSTRTGVGGITQQAYNVLHFPRSTNISFSVVNLADNDSLLNLELYDDAGNFKAATTQGISPGMQFARYFTDLLGTEAQSTQRWVRAFMTQSETYGLWLVNEGGKPYLDGTRVPDIRTALLELVLPVMMTTDDHSTSLVLINPNLDPANVQLFLYSSTGSLKATLSRNLAGRARLVLDAATVFPSVAETDSVFVRSDRAIFGLELFGNDDAMACLEGIPAGGSHTVLYSPHLATGDWGVIYESILTLVNTTGSGAQLTVSRYNDDGVQQGPPQTVNLPSLGKVSLDVATLFSLTGAQTGYLEIDANGATGIVGSITFGDAVGDEFVSCLPLQWTGGEDYILGHIANGTLGAVGYFTGIAILNADAQAHDVTISAYDQAGILKQSQALNIQPNQRRVFLLDGLMPGLGAIFGGYITLDGPDNARLMVFELFGSSPTLDFLSAVPAVSR